MTTHFFFKLPIIGIILILTLIIASASTSIETFEDGDYTATPKWDLNLGSFDVNAYGAYSGVFGLANTNGGAADIIKLYLAPFVLADTNYILQFYMQCTPAANSGNNYVGIDQNSNLGGNNVYPYTGVAINFESNDGDDSCSVKTRNFLAGASVNEDAFRKYLVTDGPQWVKVQINIDNVGHKGKVLVFDSNGEQLAGTGIPYVIPSDFNSMALKIGVEDVNAYYDDVNIDVDSPDVTPPSVGATTVMDFKVYDSGLQKYFKGTGKIKGGAASDLGTGIDTTTCEVQYFNAGAWFAGDWNIEGTHCQSSAFTAANATTYEMNTRVKDLNNNQGTGTASATYIGDSAAPTTTITTVADIAEIDARTLRLTCVDAGSGCKNLYYKADSNTWTKSTTNPLDFTITGLGSHTILYNSVDNLDTNENLNTYDFNLGADLNFTFYDENTGNYLTNITTTFNGNTYNSGTDHNQTLSLDGLSGSKIVAFSKTGYLTRYYQYDVNQFEDKNVSFLMLGDINATNVAFKFYKPDQNTLLTNADVNVLHIARNKIAGRLKTNASGEVTFAINGNDGNYSFQIIASDGNIYNYNPVLLTILKPKAEATGLIIDANWGITISGIASISDLNKSKDVTSADKNIYSDLVNPYLVTINSESTSPEYLNRTYSISSKGNNAVSLQPYLVTSDDGTTVKLVTKQDNGATIEAYPDITIKIYKYLPGGRSLIEQTTTDDKGETLVSLTVGDSYEFELYDSNNARIYFGSSYISTIKVTAATIYFTIDTSGSTTSYPAQKYWYITNWNPSTTYITKLNTGTKVFGFTIANPKATDMNIISIVYQNDHNFRVDNNISSATSFTVTHPGINWSDINKGIVTQKIILRVDGNVYVFIQNYTISTAWGGYYDPIQGLKTGLRTDLGCQATGYCIPTLILAVLICTGLVVFIALKTSLVGGQGSAILFALGLVLFTYLTWVPLELTLVVVLIVGAFVINDRGHRGEA